MGIVGEFSFIFMQSFTLGELFFEWERFGVFDLVLPFLLIFSIIFGVLSTTRILGKNNGINLIISMVIALLALRLEFVSLFFTELFPRFALGLVALIVMVILAGLFIPDEKRALKGWYTFFGIVAVVIAVVSILQTFSVFNFFGSRFWQDYATVIISSIVVIAVLIGIVVGMRDPKDKAGDLEPYQIGFLRK